MLRQIAQHWEANQEYLKQCLGCGEGAPFPGWWVHMPQIPSPRFNHVSGLALQHEQMRWAVGVALRWFESQGLPFACIMTSPATEPANLSAQLTAMGWSLETNPVMLRRRAVEIPPSEDVEVRLSTQLDEPDFFGVMASVFLQGAGLSQVELGRRNVRLVYEEGARNYLAFYRGQLAGIGTLYSRDGMGGIYNMGTLPEYRGRGVARAILRQAITDSELQEDRWLCLTPTQMGRPLYEALGFEEVYQEKYHVFRLRPGA